MGRDLTVLPAGDGGASSTWRRRLTTPPDMLRLARRRLGFLALVMALLSGTALVHSVIQLVLTRGQTAAVGLTVMSAFSVLLSLWIYLVTRMGRFTDGQVLRAGRKYEVLLCLAISVGVPWFIHATFGHVPHMTWVGVIIVFFPLIVPAAPTAVLLHSLTAAAMVPLGLGIAVWMGLLPPQPAFRYVGVAIAPTLCAGLAYIGARALHHIGAELSKARQLGAYQLERRLGRGGMGEVWQARHRLLSRAAAVKLIQHEALEKEGEGAGLMKRFELEAETTANLRSPHIVELYDFGRTAEGSFYYVMELLDGVDLQRLVDEYGALPASRVAHLLRQICHSLREAHRAGLIHRDIKPANVFLCRYGEDVDFVKVLDFGLVKRAVATGETDDPQLTRPDAAIGTPAFMAPEVATGSGPVDGRADLYAVGCVAYWLLTGRPVFEGRTGMAVMVKHAKETPVPVSKLAELEVPAALEGLVMACLEKSPGDRPESAEALMQALDELAFDEPWPDDAARRWWDRHRPEGLVDEPESAGEALPQEPESGGEGRDVATMDLKRH